MQGYLGYYISEDVGINTYRLLGVTNFQGIALKYTFRMKGEFHNDRALFYDSNLCIEVVEQIGANDWEKTGEILSTEYLNTYFDPGEKKYIDFEQTVT